LYVDSARIGIYGHSYGGFMATLAMLKASDKFKVGVAGSPVTNFALYNTNYKVATFHFKSDGSTDLTSTTNSLSLVLQNEKAGPNGLPANFQTTSINPLNGAVRSFRP